MPGIKDGETIKNILDRHNVAIINNGQPTHFDSRTANFSNVDLTLCTPDLVLDLNYEISDDLHGSDHFPISIFVSSDASPLTQRRFILDRADWRKFEQLTHTDMEPSDDIDETVEQFNAIITNAAELSIPRTSGRPPKSPVPWWSAECELANSDRKRSLRQYQRSRSIADKILYHRARARFIKRRARKESWKRFLIQ